MADFTTAVAALRSELDAVAAELLALSANPKPFYIVNQQSMDATGYRRYLGDRIDQLHKQIRLLDGPFRIKNYMRPV